MEAARRTFVLTPALKVAVDPSVEQPPTNLTYGIKIIECVCIKYYSSHVINYQHASIAFAIIIEVALQEYEEYKYHTDYREPLNVTINV